MVLSKALEQVEGPSQAPGQNGHGAETGGYSPERAHPLMLQQSQEPGKYDSYLATVRHMVHPEMRTLSDYVRSGHYRNRLLEDLAHRYYHHTQWQIRSVSSMLNYFRVELLKEKAWLEALLLGLNQPNNPAEVAAMAEGTRTELLATGISYSANILKQDDARPLTAIIPVTLGEAYERITDITSQVQSLALRIRRAQAKGIYYDVGPLLAYWKTPYHERGDLDPTLGPGFMVRLNDIIDISSAEVWRRQARGIISQTAGDSIGQEKYDQGGEEAPKKRSMLGRLIRK